jgi:hypothetical protein
LIKIGQGLCPVDSFFSGFGSPFIGYSIIIVIRHPLQLSGAIDQGWIDEYSVLIQIVVQPQEPLQVLLMQILGIQIYIVRMKEPRQIGSPYKPFAGIVSQVTVDDVDLVVLDRCEIGIFRAALERQKCLRNA